MVDTGCCLSSLCCPEYSKYWYSFSSGEFSLHICRANNHSVRQPFITAVASLHIKRIKIWRALGSVVLYFYVSAIFLLLLSSLNMPTVWSVLSSTVPGSQTHFMIRQLPNLAEHWHWICLWNDPERRISSTLKKSKSNKVVLRYCGFRLITSTCTVNWQILNL